MKWDEIDAELQQNGNVRTFTMAVLRDAHGAGKLGSQVVNTISKDLARMGLGHVPKDLPTYQDEQVRVYKKGTPVGEMIDRVLEPGERNDRALVDQFSPDGPDYADIAERIRELVSD